MTADEKLGLILDILRANDLHDSTCRWLQALQDRPDDPLGRRSDCNCWLSRSAASRAEEQQ